MDRNNAAQNIDCVIISQSEVIDYKKYNSMPLDRVELFRNLVQLRMVYYDKGFRPHLDLFNKALYNKYFHEASYSERKKLLSIWNLPALNGVAVASPLIEAGLNVQIINNFDAEYDVMIECRKKMANPIIGISTTFILEWSEIGRIIKAIYKGIPEAVIILGGAFVNSMFLRKGLPGFEKPMRKYGIDYVIHSHNSEKDMLSLIIYLKNGKADINMVNNLLYFEDKKVFRNTKAVWNEPNLNYPGKLWSKIDKFMNIGGMVQIRTSCGCPFKCAFCDYPVVSGGFQTAKIDSVKLQLDAITGLKSVKSIVFIDDTLNVPQKRFSEIIDLVCKYSFRWYSFIRAQYLDEKTAKNMKKSGCDGVYLGLESASDVILKNMNKKSSRESYEKGVELLLKYDIPVFAMFVIGFPGETEKTIDENISFIERTGVTYYGIKEFWYSHSAPVHSRREEYQLEGEGHVWKHNTMTSTEASRTKLEMFERIKNSVYVDADMGLWYLLYLRENGFDWGKIYNSQKIINKMIHLDNKGFYDTEEKKELFNKFSRLINNGKNRHQ